MGPADNDIREDTHILKFELFGSFIFCEWRPGCNQRKNTSRVEDRKYKPGIGALVIMYLNGQALVYFCESAFIHS